MRFLGLCIFMMLGCYCLALQAQSTLQQNLSAQNLPKLSGNASLSYNSNLYQTDSYAYNASTFADLTLNYRIKNGHLIRAYTAGFQEHTQGQETKVNDGFIGWVNNAFWGRSEVFTLGQQLRLNMPYSKDSRVRDTKLFGVSVVPVVIANLAPVGIKNVLVIYQPQMIKNAHTYEVNRAGVSNTSYAMNHTLVGVYSPTDNLYFQPVFVYGQAWTYNNRKKDDVYQFAFEAGYMAFKNTTIALGWSNAGALRNLENGNDQTITLFDNQTSTIYGAINYVF